MCELSKACLLNEANCEVIISGSRLVKRSPFIVPPLPGFGKVKEPPSRRRKNGRRIAGRASDMLASHVLLLHVPFSVLLALFSNTGSRRTSEAVADTLA